MSKRLLSIFALLFSLATVNAQTVIIDHEDANTSTTFQYFGSTLQDEISNIVANPNPSGINTSANVGEHIKPAGSEVWAGAFSNPNPTIPVDVTTAAQVCMKVHFPETGSATLKLENATNGVSNWINTVDVTTANAWTEVCFNVAEASFEDPFQPASGGIFETVTLFFNFGTSFTEDQTYYFDDIVVSGQAATEGDYTFSVDMSNYTDPFTQVYVSGTFNDWSGDANPLMDMGNGIWSATIENIPVGLQEYKFTLDNWAAQEQFSGTETCTITDPSGQFVNRQLIITGDGASPNYCFNSCYECGQGVQITFNVGATHIMQSPDGLTIAGGGNFGVPGDYPLSDDDGDGVYTITLERQVGFSSYYTFTNGICPDFSCKENIAGQDCADPANFNDRFLSAVSQDTTINTCFEICTTDLDCGDVLEEANIVFTVDMNDYAGTFDQVYISGQFNSWSGDANPLTDNSDGTWSTTLQLFPGNYEYKFTLDNWSADEIFTDGDPCTITDPSGAFVNRLIVVDGDTEVCFPWESCEMCLVNTNEVTFAENLFTIAPTVTTDITRIQFNNEFAGEKEISVVNAVGQQLSLEEIAANASEMNIDLSNYNSGVYFIHVKVGSNISTKRVVKL